MSRSQVLLLIVLTLLVGSGSWLVWFDSIVWLGYVLMVVAIPVAVAIGNQQPVEGKYRAVVVGGLLTLGPWIQGRRWLAAVYFVLMASPLLAHFAAVAWTRWSKLK